jgi:hypothetical protein
VRRSDAAWRPSVPEGAALHRHPYSFRNVARLCMTCVFRWDHCPGGAQIDAAPWPARVVNNSTVWQLDLEESREATASLSGSAVACRRRVKSA